MARFLVTDLEEGGRYSHLVDGTHKSALLETHTNTGESLVSWPPTTRPQHATFWPGANNGRDGADILGNGKSYPVPLPPVGSWTVDVTELLEQAVPDSLGIP